jgi:hypothetical protein
MAQVHIRLQNVLQNAKKRASRKGVAFDIDMADVLRLWDSQQGQCALSGRELLLATATGGSLQDSPSLDQIVAGRGYTVDNVQLLTTQCNLSKSTLACKDFVDLCEQVYFYSKTNGRSTPS